ncbi:MAG TPA: hypothetical protein VG797_04040, partial [Phycisphaerales bacterium]|nr:hypothetical protein [Phycisphaerales bacterium]
AGMGSNPIVGRAMDLSIVKLRENFCGDDPPMKHIPTLLNEVMDEAGVRGADPRLIDAFRSNYFLVIAERLHRHTTLEWAAEICRRREWRMRIYGRGWERHPKLAEFAQPGINHDNRLLCAAYRSACTCLHASLATNAHQRVAECALSGGLMLRRGPCPDHELIVEGLRRRAFIELTPEKKDERGVWWYDLSPLQEIYGQYRHFSARSRFVGSGMNVLLKTRAFEKNRGERADPIDEIDPRVFPDVSFPNAQETLFESRAELEEQLSRAIGDSVWRQKTIAGHAEAAREWMTTDRFAAELLELVFSGLGCADGGRR